MADTENQLWHDILGQLKITERVLTGLIESIVRHHDEHHSQALRWCPSPPCRHAVDAHPSLLRR